MTIDRVKIIIGELNDKKYHDALEYLRSILETKVREPKLVRDSEWETIKAAITQEAKLEVLKQFFDLIENYEGIGR